MRLVLDTNVVVAALLWPGSPNRLIELAAGDAAEHRARHEPRAARVVEVEQPAHHFARRVKSRDAVEIEIEHLARVPEVVAEESGSRTHAEL